MHVFVFNFRILYLFLLFSSWKGASNGYEHWYEKLYQLLCLFDIYKTKPLRLTSTSRGNSILVNYYGVPIWCFQARFPPAVDAIAVTIWVMISDSIWRCLSFFMGVFSLAFEHDFFKVSFASVFPLSLNHIGFLFPETWLGKYNFLEQ